MKKQKGITLVETIVAMAIVVIVSVLAYTTISFSVSINGKNKAKSFFASETQNYVKCYFLGEAQYNDAIKLLTDIDTTFGENLKVYYDIDFSKTTQTKANYYVDLVFEDSKFYVKSYSLNSQTPIFEIEV